MTEEQTTEILTRQTCDACGQPRTTEMHIDHDHATGSVRGLLHPNCNVGIGQAADNAELLHQWSTYLAAQTFDLVQLCAR